MVFRLSWPPASKCFPVEMQIPCRNVVRLQLEEKSSVLARALPTDWGTGQHPQWLLGWLVEVLQWMCFVDKFSSPANHYKMSPALPQGFLLLQPQAQAEPSAVKIWALKMRSLSPEWFHEPLPHTCVMKVRQGTTKFLSDLLVTSKQPAITNPQYLPYVGGRWFRSEDRPCWKLTK